MTEPRDKLINELLAKVKRMERDGRKMAETIYSDYQTNRSQIPDDFLPEAFTESPSYSLRRLERDVAEEAYWIGARYFAPSDVSDETLEEHAKGWAHYRMGLIDEDGNYE